LSLQPAHHRDRAPAGGQRLVRRRLRRQRGLAGRPRRHPARHPRQPAPPPALPYVPSVPLPDGVGPGSRLPPGNELANALAALGGMAPQLKREVTGVAPRTLDSLEFTLKDGTRVLYGLAVDQPAKDAAVSLVRRTLKREGREAPRIDVRTTSAPTGKATPANNNE